MTEPRNGQNESDDEPGNEEKSFLEKGKMVNMIVYLYKNGTTSQQELRNIYGQKATERNLPLLKSLGLAEDYYPPPGSKGYKYRIWRLTKNGLWTGEQLAHIELLIRDEVVLDDLTDEPENYKAPPDVRFGDDE